VKQKRFSVEQIVAVLKQAEAGVPLVELLRRVGVSEQTFYRWKKQYVGLEADQVRQFKQLQEENTRLKQVVADLTLDKTMLQDVLQKNCEALAAPPGCELSARRVPGEPGARLPCGTNSGLHLSVPAHPRASDVTAAVHTENRPSPSALQLPEHPGAAEARGMAGSA